MGVRPFKKFAVICTRLRSLKARCTQGTAASGCDRSMTALRETTSNCILNGLDGLTHLRSQHEPDCIVTEVLEHLVLGHSLTCHGVLVVFDSHELAQHLDTVDWQRLREQISRISRCSNPHHIQAAFIPRRLQPKMSRAHMFRQPKSLTCCGPPTLGFLKQLLRACCSRSL